MSFIKKLWKVMGPGFVTGAADDDPSGITTYSQMGAQAGFGLLWLSVFSYPFLGAVQEMCARIGLATGTGLAENIKRHYSIKTLYLCALLLFVANVFNIGANLGAMAEATRLIFPGINFMFLVVLFGLGCLLLEIFISYKRYSQYLKYLGVVLLAYIFSSLLVDINWSNALKSAFWPSINFTKNEIILICAGLGTTISPYLFFWQTSQEVEEEILRGNKTEEKRRKDISSNHVEEMRMDVWVGMFISNLVMFFIITSCASALFMNGVTNINTAADAANALRPFAGELSYILFALGIVGTGLLSIPVLAGSASYAISESFGWKGGLHQQWAQARDFYKVIMAAVVLGILFNFLGFNPIKTLIYSAVLNGLIAPIILFFVVRLSGREDIMGEFKNKWLGNFVGWLTFSLMFVVGVAAIISLLG